MKRVLALFFLLLTLNITPVQASPLQDSLIPDDGEKSIGTVELEHKKYPLSRYNLDLYIEETWNPLNVVGHISDEVQALRLDIVNGIWSFSRTISIFSIVTVGHAFKLDIVASVIDVVGEAIQIIAGFSPSGFHENGLWPLLILFIITLVGAWAAYMALVKRQQSLALSSLLTMILLFAFSLGFFSQAGAILGGANAVSKEIQSRILTISGMVMNPGKSYKHLEGVAVVQNQMFDILIKKPYFLMQYGSAMVDPVRGDELLKNDFNSETRNNIVKDEVLNKGNVMMSEQSLGDRTWFVLLQLLAGAILAGQVSLMSGSVLFFQVIFIAFVLFAPVPLLIALVPAWRDSALSWGMKALHALLMKVGIALLMTVIFTISGLIYIAVDPLEYGFLVILALQILIYVGIWLKRKELFSIVNRVSKGESSHKGDAMSSYFKMRAAGHIARKLVGNKRSNRRDRMNWQPAKRGKVAGSKREKEDNESTTSNENIHARSEHVGGSSYFKKMMESKQPISARRKAAGGGVPRRGGKLILVSDKMHARSEHVGGSSYFKKKMESKQPISAGQEAAANNVKAAKNNYTHDRYPGGRSEDRSSGGAAENKSMTVTNRKKQNQKRETAATPPITDHRKPSSSTNNETPQMTHNTDKSMVAKRKPPAKTRKADRPDKAVSPSLEPAPYNPKHKRFPSPTRISDESDTWIRIDDEAERAKARRASSATQQETAVSAEKKNSKDKVSVQRDTSVNREVIRKEKVTKNQRVTERSQVTRNENINKKTVRSEQISRTEDGNSDDPGMSLVRKLLAERRSKAQK
ncbi:MULTISPECIES: MFS transporter [Paenibacillus]|uniref:MFS transporter n=1 Tax=Paenibacillus TaxID=44249 RepID=UPI001BCDFD45|nr:MFS transporter [Paenibacillus dendritiformis]